MNITISSDNMQISPSMKSLAEQKLQKFQRHWEDYPQDSISVRVVLNSAPDEQFVTRIEVDLNGDKYYTEAQGFDLENSLIQAIDELDRQYQKQKAKQTNQWPQRREQKVVSEQDLLNEIDDIQQ